MSSGFPSIDEIMPAKKSLPKSAAPAIQAAFKQKITEIGIKEKEQVVKSRAEQLQLPYIDLSTFPVSAEALKFLSESEAKEKKIVCFYYSTEEIRIGVIEPDPAIIEHVLTFGEKFHAHVLPYLISEHSYEHVMKLYSTLPIIKPVSKDINITDEELNRFNLEVNNLQTLKDSFKNVSISDVLTLMIASAIKLNASDVHIEAEEKGVAMRYRVDGVLHDVVMLPREQWKQFISRIKLLAALKMNVTDRPQDGRVTLRLSEDSLDIRVSTMPTMWGESVVMRILHSGTKGVTFDELGLRGEAHARLKREIERPNGMIITTGPTGSGKTTTLYGILRTLNKPGVKIITLEDPIEIKMEGLNQSQVDPGRDYTFAKGLRSILRQDPDICMVGEIRDLETAEISIQAALTGHLMLSTIHTNSASGAIPRFLSMGVKPFLLAPALNSIMGQRLVRRICEKCIEEAVVEGEKMEKIAALLEKLPPAEKQNVDMNNLHFYKGKGCEKCSGLGYKGRIGIYEIFTMSKEIEEVILSAQVSEYVIEELAVKNGMVTMVQDGILKALDKVTTVDEVFRVTE
jgi:type IV pilus assembly protein PilB